VSEILSNPLVVGGASAGLTFYFVTTVIQAIGIYKLCSKMGFKRARKITLTALVVIPFGIEASLLLIAYDKRRDKRKES